MRGISRASLADLVRRFDTVDGDLAALGEELFETLHLLDREHGLRRALADPAHSAARKTEVVHALLDARLAATTVELVGEVVSARWASGGDLADAVEHLAVLAFVRDTERAGRLDDLEDELFRFGRIVEANPALRAVLADPGASAEGKRALLRDLLAQRATPATLRLVTEVATLPRGRSLERGLATFAKIAADRRQRLVAVVRTAVPLSDEQKQRLVAALSAAYGHEVHLNVELDPAVVGGLTVQVGDEVIDGSVASRLEEVRRRLAG